MSDPNRRAKAFALFLFLSTVASMARAEDSSPRQDADLRVTCVGAADAPNRAIYLHGKRPITTPEAASGLVGPLTKTAIKLGYRFAIPMANDACVESDKTFCWRGERRENLERTWNAITKAASRCFGGSGMDFGVIGFSNGGYHVIKVVMKGLVPAPRWAIAIGAAGHPGHVEGKDFAARAPLTILAGQRDGIRSEARTLAAKLVDLGFAAKFKSYEGGHDIPMTELEDELASHSAVARASQTVAHKRGG